MFFRMTTRVNKRMAMETTVMATKTEDRIMRSTAMLCSVWECSHYASIWVPVIVRSVSMEGAAQITFERNLMLDFACSLAVTDGPKRKSPAPFGDPGSGIILRFVECKTVCQSSCGTLPTH